jgi:hypothetical protein
MFYVISAFAFAWLGVMAYYYYTNPVDRFIYKLSLFLITIGFQLVAGAIAVKLLKNINIYVFIAINFAFFVFYCAFYILYMAKKIKNIKK